MVLNFCLLSLCSSWFYVFNALLALTGKAGTVYPEAYRAQQVLRDVVGSGGICGVRCLGAPPSLSRGVKQVVSTGGGQETAEGRGFGLPSPWCTRCHPAPVIAAAGMAECSGAAAALATI